MCGGVGVVQPNVGVKRRGVNTYPVSLWEQTNLRRQAIEDRFEAFLRSSWWRDQLGEVLKRAHELLYHQLEAVRRVGKWAVGARRLMPNCPAFEDPAGGREEAAQWLRSKENHCLADLYDVTAALGSGAIKDGGGGFGDNSEAGAHQSRRLSGNGDRLQPPQTLLQQTQQRREVIGEQSDEDYAIVYLREMARSFIATAEGCADISETFVLDFRKRCVGICKRIERMYSEMREDTLHTVTEMEKWISARVTIENQTIHRYCYALEKDLGPTMLDNVIVLADYNPELRRILDNVEPVASFRPRYAVTK